MCAIYLRGGWMTAIDSFRAKTGLFLGKRVARWPRLQKYVSEGALSDIDYFFAETMLPDGGESEAALVCALMAASRQGHLCLKIDGPRVTPSFDSLDELIVEGSRLMSVELLEGKPVCRFGDLFYLEKNWAFETRFIQEVKRLIGVVPAIAASGEFLDSTLNKQQQESVAKAMGHGLSLVTGGPGTGKTYVASRIVKRVVSCCPEGCRIVLAAPTGKAAAHLESGLMKVMDRPAHFKCGTLHAVMNIRSQRDYDREISYLQADLIIIDECSMIDARLFSYFLASVKEGTRVVLIGDKDQLPPVEAGSLFADLIQAAEGGYPIAYTYLSQSLRTDRQEILKLAALVKAGKDVTEEIAHLRIDAGMSAKDPHKVLEIVDSNFPHPSFERPHVSHSFSILCCLRQGPLGVDALNAMIVEHYLSKIEIGQWWAAPILITRSDYGSGIYNGETAMLFRKCQELPMRENKFEKRDTAHFADGRQIPAFALPSFEYAYCLSVHKSQGAEYERVLLLMPPGSEAFGREALYTAITRARTKLEIDGADEVIKKAIGLSTRRISGLQERM